MSLCKHCGADDDCYEVSCARCSADGCCQSFVPEEGDEWECPRCNERENARERQS